MVILINKKPRLLLKRFFVNWCWWRKY